MPHLRSKEKSVCSIFRMNKDDYNKEGIYMNEKKISEIMSCVDHTLLSQSATWNEIKVICDDAVRFKTASVCIPPSFVKQAFEYLKGSVPVCTVIGFPNGYNTKEVKCYETRDAIENGASEIDMVINIGDLKAKKHDKILDEIKAVKASCNGRILKVIIETCLLDDEEKIKMCHIVTGAGADFIKTSTGFSKGGATEHDIELFANNVGSNVKIKAAGGIKSFEDAESFLRLGASRLGTSRLVALLKSSDTISNY